jgi:hypothetical protein
MSKIYKAAFTVRRQQQVGQNGRDSLFKAKIKPITSLIMLSWRAVDSFATAVALVFDCILENVGWLQGAILR